MKSSNISRSYVKKAKSYGEKGINRVAPGKGKRFCIDKENTRRRYNTPLQYL